MTVTGECWIFVLICHILVNLRSSLLHLQVSLVWLSFAVWGNRETGGWFRWMMTSELFVPVGFWNSYRNKQTKRDVTVISVNNIMNMGVVFDQLFCVNDSCLSTVVLLEQLRLERSHEIALWVKELDRSTYGYGFRHSQLLFVICFSDLMLCFHHEITILVCETYSSSVAGLRILRSAIYRGSWVFSLEKKKKQASFFFQSVKK